VSFRFSNGQTVKLTSYTVKVALGLKSPNFAISGFPMERVQGPDRYATAVAVSQKAFSGTAPTVVLASGQDYPDALSGSALAGASKGSLLLSARASLPDSTRAELKRLAPAKVYIMGSSAALSTAVESAVKSVLTTATVERVAGPNRYDTAVAAARKVAEIAPPSKVIVVSGTAWPDAASASALAYAKSYPVLLMRPTDVGASASAFLAQYKPESALFVGGANIVSDRIKTAVGAITGKATVRASGANRYDTAAAVARHSVTVEGFTATDAYLATGLNYADALTGGMLAGVRTQPLLLMQKDACPGGTAYFLREHKATLTKLWVFGSAAAVSEKGMSSLDSVMMQ
jgi:putative cell wall-binding protein